MKKSDFNISIYDPHVKKNDKFLEKKVKYLKSLNKKSFFDAIFLGTQHKKILKIGGKKIKSFCKKKSFIYDLKSSLDEKYIDASLY